MRLFKKKATPEQRDAIRDKAAQRMSTLSPAEILTYAEQYLGASWMALDGYKREPGTERLVEFLTNLSTLDGIADALAARHL
ncbi:hypothetical protein ACIBCT_35040 [Streptosporangium sp. NPDC050855]|uniref:hypothetical protein n=1 Tax=Streptosporangium sp. NPDC050855 TaxID=3366194 RepID=UPI0037B494B0